MNSRLNFRWLWLLAFILSAPWAMAQNDIPALDFAGEDHTFLNPSSNPNEINVPIGIDEVYDNDDSYYEWSLILPIPLASNIHLSDDVFGDRNKHRTTALVDAEGEWHFELLRMSKYGYQLDEVTVKVVNYPEIVSIKTKNECYVPDYDLSIGDFEIETDPPGYSHLFQVAEESKTTIPNMHQVFFTVRGIYHEPKPALRSCPIYVFDRVFVGHFDTPSVNFLAKNNQKERDVLKQFRAIPKLSEDMAKYYDSFLAKGKKGHWADALDGKSPFTPIAGCRYRLSFYQKCCPVDGQADEYVHIKFEGRVGVSFYLPVQTPIPGVYAIATGLIEGRPDLNGMFEVPASWSELGRGNCDDDLFFSVLVVGEVGAGIGFGFPGLANCEASFLFQARTSWYFPIAKIGEKSWKWQNGYVDARIRFKTNIACFDAVKDFTVFQIGDISLKDKDN